MDHMNKLCLIREHVPDITGICKVCGEECFRACDAETTRWYSDVPINLECQLFAGHEEDHDFGFKERHNYE